MAKPAFASGSLLCPFGYKGRLAKSRKPRNNMQEKNKRHVNTIKEAMVKNYTIK